MSFLQAIILKSLQSINGERTIYSVYHLLKGKKSSQTIQDAHFFNLSFLFQSFPSIQRNDFEQLLNDLEDHSYINIDQGKKAMVTDKGAKYIDTFLITDNLKYLNGLKYGDTAIKIWKRLSLIIQVLSNLNDDNRLYYPVQRDIEIQSWLKKFLRQQIESQEKISKKLHDELFALFSDRSPEDPTILIIRFTGSRHIGYTVEQAADYLQLETTEYWYRFLHLLHFMVNEIVVHHRQYPLLHLLISDSFQQTPLTISTLKTYQLLKQGLTLSKIASLRKLKENTIEDHIIEIALNNLSCNFEEYIDSETENEIVEAAKELGQRKLKPIKEKVQKASYFQIRLALAKKVNGHDNNL